MARGKQEVAEASRARATPRLCLLAEEDDRGGGWRWAGPASAAGRTGRRQVGLLLFFNFSFSVFILCHYFFQI